MSFVRPVASIGALSPKMATFTIPKGLNWAFAKFASSPRERFASNSNAIAPAVSQTDGGLTGASVKAATAFAGSSETLNRRGIPIGSRGRGGVGSTGLPGPATGEKYCFFVAAAISWAKSVVL
jgi:hypothetical protein